MKHLPAGICTQNLWNTCMLSNALRICATLACWHAYALGICETLACWHMHSEFVKNLSAGICTHLSAGICTQNWWHLSAGICAQNLWNTCLLEYANRICETLASWHMHSHVCWHMNSEFVKHLPAGICTHMSAGIWTQNLWNTCQLAYALTCLLAYELRICASLACWHMHSLNFTVLSRAFWKEIYIMWC